MTLNETGNASSVSTITSIIQDYIPLVVEICGIIGTTFLLCILTIQRKCTKMPSTVHLALCYLLIIDLSFLTLGMCDDVFIDFLKDPLSDKSAFSCYAMMILLSSFASLQGYIQCIISIERVLAIALPFKVKILVTRRRMAGALIGVSLTMLALRIAYTVYGYTYTSKFDNNNKVRGRCDIETTSVLFLGIFDSVIFCLIPATVLSLCTCVIIILVIRHRRLSMTPTRVKLSAVDIRLSLTLVIMDVLYIATCVPFNVDLYGHYLQKDPSELDLIGYHKLPSKLTRLAAATDWFVLFCLSTQVRKAAKKVCMCKRWQHERIESS